MVGGVPPAVVGSWVALGRSLGVGRLCACAGAWASDMWCLGGRKCLEHGDEPHQVGGSVSSWVLHVQNVLPKVRGLWGTCCALKFWGSCLMGLGWVSLPYGIQHQFFQGWVGRQRGLLCQALRQCLICLSIFDLLGGADPFFFRFHLVIGEAQEFA